LSILSKKTKIVVLIALVTFIISIFLIPGGNVQANERLGYLSFQSSALPKDERQEMEQMIEQRLQKITGFEFFTPAAVKKYLGEDYAAAIQYCTFNPECIKGQCRDKQMDILVINSTEKYGRQYTINIVVAFLKGQYGETVTLRKKVAGPFDNFKTEFAQSLQRLENIVLSSSKHARPISSAIAPTIAEMTPLLPPISPQVSETMAVTAGEPLPWYSNWWVWTATGAVVAGGVGSYLVLKDSSPQKKTTSFQLNFAIPSHLLQK